MASNWLLRLLCRWFDFMIDGMRPDSMPPVANLVYLQSISKVGLLEGRVLRENAGHRDRKGRDLRS